MTQAEVARKLGMHPQRLNNLANGHLHAGVKTGVLLKKTFGGSLDIWCLEEGVKARRQLIDEYLARGNK